VANNPTFLWSSTVPLFALRGDVAVITLNNPPVNSPSHALRSQIVDAIRAAEESAQVRAIVLQGHAKAFSASADVTEIGTSAQAAFPGLPQVIECLERCQKPVVAAARPQHA
jgi:3-hydroxyacyl-CoA dehydrogenase